MIEVKINFQFLFFYYVYIYKYVLGLFVYENGIIYINMYMNFYIDNGIQNYGRYRLLFIVLFK